LAELAPPNTLAVIGESAFRDCSGLAELTLPDALAAISDNAFYGCSGLVELSLPDTLTSIDKYAFYGCSGLVKLNLPNTLTAIGYNAFSGCSGLVELSLPDTATPIDEHAFLKCTNLRWLVLPPALVSLGPTAFEESTTNLKMLAVPFTVAAEIVLTVAAMFGSGAESSYCSGSSHHTQFGEAEEADFPNVSNLPLVSAPDVIVPSLSGAFATTAAMTEVCAAGRDVSGVVEHCFWSVKTHLHQVCSRGQRACAHTLLLVRRGYTCSQHNAL
jgi:hypothetical protein